MSSADSITNLSVIRRKIDSYLLRKQLRQRQAALVEQIIMNKLREDIPQEPLSEPFLELEEEKYPSASEKSYEHNGLLESELNINKFKDRINLMKRLDSEVDGFIRHNPDSINELFKYSILVKKFNNINTAVEYIGEKLDEEEAKTQRDGVIYNKLYELFKIIINEILDDFKSEINSYVKNPDPSKVRGEEDEFIDDSMKYVAEGSRDIKEFLIRNKAKLNDELELLKTQNISAYNLIMRNFWGIFSWSSSPQSDAWVRINGLRAAAGKKRISRKQLRNILKNKTIKSSSTIKKLDSDIFKILNS